ncbi:conserved protein of unknown function (Doubtful CDS) [Bradyrhizobium sp. ORS 285]|nr:conserved protein of unknown function (Doubtful CDS) [Bradyrhizobium sp. ORS 285]
MLCRTKFLAPISQLAQCNLAPRAARGRIASPDAIRVRGYRLTTHITRAAAPHPNPLPVRTGRGSAPIVRR